MSHPCRVLHFPLYLCASSSIFAKLSGACFDAEVSSAIVDEDGEEAGIRAVAGTTGAAADFDRAECA